MNTEFDPEWLARRRAQLTRRINQYQAKVAANLTRLAGDIDALTNAKRPTIPVLGMSTTRMRELADTLDNLSQIVVRLTHDTDTSFVREMTRLSRFRDELDEEHSRTALILENWDENLACRMIIGPDGERCGEPTVCGAGWCARHIDCWCDLHGHHMQESIIAEDGQIVREACPACR